MSTVFFRRTCIVVLPLVVGACAAPGPAPLGAQHPANPAAASAPAYSLQVLRTYQDFSSQPAQDGKSDDEVSTEGADHHVH